MNTDDFLRAVVTANEGWFLLALGPANGQGWWEEWFRWPGDVGNIVLRANEICQTHNVYFTSYLFDEQRSTKEHVLETRTVQADLDEADVLTLPFPPSILVETSPGRHQGYWVLKQPPTLQDHELISKQLTYSIDRCDKSGWALGRRVRLPNTYNHKYLSGPKQVRVVQSGKRTYQAAELELLPPSTAPTNVEEPSFDWLDNVPKVIRVGPQEMLQAVRGRLPSRVVVQYNVRAQDRSAALWALLMSAFRAGLTREEVFYLAKHSANNKFDDLRYHSDRELAKDVLRAEAAATNRTPDARARILEARRLPGLVAERRQYMASIVRDTLNRTGEFTHTVEGNVWYVRQDTGRPISVSQRSEYLGMLLDTMFGLNSTEPEQAFVISNLISSSHDLPALGVTAALSYYETDTHALYLHTGRRDVLRVTATTTEKVVNGEYGIIFPWSPLSEPFEPSYQDLDEPWYELMFGDALGNLVGVNTEHALALLRVWFVFLLLRNAAVSRPILALFGQPGAGKSTLFRRVYALLYGKQRSLSAVTTADDFDYSVASDPLVVLDNADTWEPWLPDRLALSASTSETTKRKLYTDSDTVILKRQAMIGLTAHAPKFGREDVTDRLVLLTFERLRTFKPELDIINRILACRNQIWGAIVSDVQTVFRTPVPALRDIPQFRVEDFARLGAWVATALGIKDTFAASLSTVQLEQKSFNLEEEAELIEAIHLWVSKYPATTRDYHTIGAVWTALESCSRDPMAFVKRYKSAVFLGKKLWSLQDSLRSVFDVEWLHDRATGTRQWKFKPK